MYLSTTKKYTYLRYNVQLLTRGTLIYILIILKDIYIYIIHTKIGDKITICITIISTYSKKYTLET